ncbi:MAG: hypothetical protein ACE5JO_03440 [Candidatus Binatia bacterium]
MYRLLFTNYTEDRRLLPRDMLLHKETYDLVSLEFDLINRGSEAFGIDKDTLSVPLQGRPV